MKKETMRAVIKNEGSSNGSRMIPGQTALTGALSTAKTVAALISSYQRKANDSICRGCSQNYQDECRIFQIPRTRNEAKQRGLKDSNCYGGK